MATTDDRILINNVPLPLLRSEGLSITKEKIWSAKTGRAADGSMLGDIVAVKYKLQLSWAGLTRGQVAQIDSAISPAFFNVTFTDPATNTRVTKRMYAGTPTYPVYSYADGVKTYQGVGVDLIEK